MIIPGLTNFLIKDNQILFSSNIPELNIQILDYMGNILYNFQKSPKPHITYFISHPIIGNTQNFIVKVNNQSYPIKRTPNTISQVSFGSNISFFEDGFLNRWNLNKYYDVNSPCIFFGVAGNLERIKNHKSFKLIFPVDLSCAHHLKTLPPSKDLIIVDRPCISIPDKFSKVKGEFEIKDYSLFKPNILGDKIYAYIGSSSRHTQFKYDLIKQIQSKIDYEILLGSPNSNKTYDNINIIKSKYYDNSFLNLNFSQESGLTTVIEMALMGRKTISNNLMKWECMIPYSNLEDIVYNINQESKKINTIQPSIDIHTINEVWKNLKYWKNFI
jgi:hypothetical protein